jgi:hypothetical protein
VKSSKRNPAAILTTICCVLASLIIPAPAAELAVLRNGFSIRHDHHKIVGDTTRLFLSPDESSFTDVSTADITGFEKDLSLPAPVLAPAPGGNSSPAANLTTAPHPAPDLDQVVNSASAAYHLDPDLVNSVIHAESGFNAHAVSPKGARGLMQLMPSTANALGVRDAFDPEANVGGGSRYLRELLERYNFDLVKALAAYNAGPERVEQYRGVPPFHETRAYVARIVRDYNRKKIAQEKAAAQAHKPEAAPKKKSETAVVSKPATRSAGPIRRAEPGSQQAILSSSQLPASSARTASGAPPASAH